jgi:hypothetical protein
MLEEHGQDAGSAPEQGAKWHSRFTMPASRHQVRDRLLRMTFDD